VRTILSSGQTLLRLLNDLLDLAKIEAGKLEIESIPVSPKQILEQTLALFAESAQAKGLKIETDWRGSSASYLGDPHRLAQMLSNMTSNAIKFTSHGGIRIEAREVEGNGPGVTLEFAVSDSGMGIALDKQDFLFQRFSQLDSSITRSFGGTGLGLSIVRTLAHLMGGEVGVQSQVGQGSRFWFRIRTERLAGADGPDLAATPATDTWTAPARAPESARVLLAEDNIDHQRLIQLLLDRLGVCVILAENGQQALDAITRGESAQLILMDLHMPLLDGYATAQRIRQWEQEKQQPRRAIIALTADAYEEDRQRCLGAGMDEVLTKPVSFESLKMTLGRWLCAAPAATPAPPGAQYKALDAALLLRLLEEIEPMLENNQFDAIARFRELQDATVGTALAPALTLAASALQEFRFDKALTQLRQIKASQAWGGSEHDS
jgi:CheY-like chemotaxis protein